MRRSSWFWAFVLGLGLAWGSLGWQVLSQSAPNGAAVPRNFGKQVVQSSLKTLQPSSPGSRAATAPMNSKPDKESDDSAAAAGDEASSEARRPFEQLTQDTSMFEGLFILYRHPKNGKVYAEIQPEQLNQQYLMVMTLEGAVGEKGLYSGLPLGDFLFTLRQVNNTIQVVVPNTYFRADRGTPRQRSLERSFSDSVLSVLPIRSLHPQRQSYLVELNALLLSDVSGLSAILEGAYRPESSRTYLDRLKNFEKNTEIEAVFGFAGGGDGSGALSGLFSALPDSRSFNLRVRYSLSELPSNTGYRPRFADDRVGYFITAFQNFNDDRPQQPFVRYINRWHLEKQDPTAALSPPKQPIVFWIENTVPVEYRQAVREGILMWNRAFGKIGYQDAIVVKQMPDRADWDPADVRYNTIRWFNSTDAIFAMGPSRVNPLTGEILDADIVVDANFVRAMKQEYGSIIEQNQATVAPMLAALTGNYPLCGARITGKPLKHQLQDQRAQVQGRQLRFQTQGMGTQDLCYGLEAAQQFAVGAMHLNLLGNTLPSGDAMKTYVNDFLRELIAHEVGHTLGLRHNFRASAMLLPQELNNTEITHEKGLVASVMDYNSVNLAPGGTSQGDYFTHVIGPYDEWAIEYGYAVSGIDSTLGEKRFLQKIASRAPAPELAYATDEDVVAGLDPQVNLFDLSGDLLTYSQWQMENARRMWERIDKRYPLPGESFNDVRVAFNAVFGYYMQYASFLTNYIGGQSFNRYRYGDATTRLPFEPVTRLDQRHALEILCKNVFDSRAFQFSPEFVNKLAPSRWEHWGSNPAVLRLDYPIYENILFLQTLILYELLDYDRLARLRDGELKAPDQTLTIPELLHTLQTTIWMEVLHPQEHLSLSSLRRGLQREYMNTLIDLVLRRQQAPEDARTVARYQLKQLGEAIGRAMRKVDEQDVYTLAHLEEARDRIAKAISAPLQGQ
jgi:hypothetical protein